MAEVNEDLSTRKQTAEPSIVLTQSTSTTGSPRDSTPPPNLRHAAPWPQKWGNVAQIAAAVASLTTMTVAIIGLTTFSPVFRNLQLSEENARLSLNNHRIEQELLERRDERRSIEMANQATREELGRQRTALEQLQQSNQAMTEELEQRRRDLRQLELANRRTSEELEQRRAELRQLGAAAREQRTAAWGYVCNQMWVSASRRLENSVSEQGLRMMVWLREGVELGLVEGRYTGAELFVHDQVPAWTQTLSPDVRARFDAFLARFTSTRQSLLARPYIRRSPTAAGNFEADQDLAAQLRTVITRFADECRAAQP